MLSNNQISNQLLQKFELAIEEFNNSRPSQKLLNGLKELLEFDFESYKTKVKAEIIHNLKTKWTNPENGINPEQKIDSILFEYYTPDSVNAEAISYGIIEWTSKDDETVEVEMGFKYDFADGFEQADGFALDFFNSYVSYLELDENELLLHCYRLKGTIAIHEVFYDLYQKNLFESLNINKDFYFLFGEHDSFCFAVLSI